jgi:hypothetical protein
MTLLEIQKSKLIFPSFVLAVLVLLLAGLGAYRQGRRNVAAEQWVQHTYEVLGELNTTLSLMQDVETMPFDSSRKKSSTCGSLLRIIQSSSAGLTPWNL